MQVQVTLNLADKKQAALFDQIRAGHTGAKVETVKPGDDGETPVKRGPGRPPKAKPEEPKEDEEDFGEEPAEKEDEPEDDEEDEDEVIDEAQKKKLQTALRKFAESKGENGKSAAVNALKKFAETTAKVKKSQFEALLKKLKVA